MKPERRSKPCCHVSYIDIIRWPIRRWYFFYDVLTDQIFFLLTNYVLDLFNTMFNIGQIDIIKMYMEIRDYKFNVIGHKKK